MVYYTYLKDTCITFLNIKHFRDIQQINAIHNTVPAGERGFSVSRDNLVTWCVRQDEKKHKLDDYDDENNNNNNNNNNKFHFD